MPTIQIPNERLMLFVVAGKNYSSGTPLSKLWFAVDKVTKFAEKKLKLVEKQKEKKRREFALKGDKGVYDLNDKGQFKFDDAGLDKLLPAIEEIDSQLTEIITHIIPAGQYDDSQLTFDMRNIFEGIVIPAIDYDTFDIDNFVFPKKDEPAK